MPDDTPAVELAEALAEIARLRAELDALAPLVKLALHLAEHEDMFGYMAGRTALRGAAQAYRKAQAQAGRHTLASRG